MANLNFPFNYVVVSMRGLAAFSPLYSDAGGTFFSTLLRIADGAVARHEGRRLVSLHSIDPICSH